MQSIGATLPGPLAWTTIRRAARSLAGGMLGVLGVLLAPAAGAATIVVDSLGDSGGAGCELREAVAAIHAGLDAGSCVNRSKSDYGDNDTVDLGGLNGTIQLVRSLEMSVPVTLQGPGAGNLAVLGDRQGVNRFRVIRTGADLAVRDLTISGGSAVNWYGGGIFATAGNLSVIASTISNSLADSGGGIYFTGGGNLLIERSTISGNVAGTIGDDSGGGIFVLAGTGSPTTVTVDRSTIFGNHSYVGGGIKVRTYAPTSILIGNSTFSGNSTDIRGAAIDVTGGLGASGAALTIRNSTLAFNGPGYGALSVNITATVDNTVIAQRPGDGSACYGNTTVTSTFPSANMFSDATCGSAATPLADIGLMPLSNYGGPTRTHALTQTSAAIDRGADGICDAIGNLDQRGVVRPIDGDQDLDDLCDIGALEFEPGGYTCETGSFDVANLNMRVGESDARRKVRVLRSGGTCGRIQVDYATLQGTATGGTDYWNRSGRLTFDDGETTAQTFFVPIRDDASDEPRETVQVALSNGSFGVTLGPPALITILDDDPPPVVSITGSASVVEGSDASLTISLTAPSADDVIVGIVPSGTASRPADYHFTGSTMVIPAGAPSVTRDLHPDRIDVKADAVADAGETIVITIDGARNATISGVAASHTITIAE